MFTVFIHRQHFQIWSTCEVPEPGVGFSSQRPEIHYHKNYGKQKKRLRPSVVATVWRNNDGTADNGVSGEAVVPLEQVRG